MTAISLATAWIAAYQGSTTVATICATFCGSADGRRSYKLRCCHANPHEGHCNEQSISRLDFSYLHVAASFEFCHPRNQVIHCVRRLEDRIDSGKLQTKPPSAFRTPSSLSPFRKYSRHLEKLLYNLSGIQSQYLVHSTTCYLLAKCVAWMNPNQKDNALG